LKLRAILRSRTDLRWQPHRTSEISTWYQSQRWLRLADFGALFWAVWRGFYIRFVGCFGQRVYSPKQWVNFRFEGTSLSLPVAQLRADFGQLVYRVGGQLWADLLG
jgi:hypothetical protein